MCSLKLEDLPTDLKVDDLSLEGKTQLYWLISRECSDPSVSTGMQVGTILRPLNDLTECIPITKKLSHLSYDLSEHLITGDKRKCRK